MIIPMVSAEETRYVGMVGGNCEECYLPQKIIIEAGGIVMWENVDKTVHTVTSGTLLEPTGQFNSGLIIPTQSYYLEFPMEGIYPYYCMTHPWMNGSVVVGEKITDEEKEEHLEEHEEMVVILEDGMFTNSTGTYYANGTAVIPEFGAVAMIVLATAVIGTILITRGRLTV